MERFEDANDELNGAEYHTGKPCIERGCEKPAGTAWGSHWCQEHNAERLRRIDQGFESIMRAFATAKQNAGGRQ